MQFIPFEPGIEINGQSARSVLDGFGPFVTLASQYLLANGLGVAEAGVVVRIDEEKWYPQESWLKAFEQIAKHLGEHLLYQVGETIPRSVWLRPWVADIHAAISGLDIIYHLNHRKNGEVMYSEATGKLVEGIGHYGYEPIPNKKLIVSLCQNPYPCTFDRGLLQALARRFEPTASVLHDDSRPCRKRGADSCTYLITWR